MITIHPGRRLLVLAAAVTVALLTGACSEPSDKTAETRSDVGTTTPAGGGQAATATAQAPDEPRQAVASTTGQHRASPNNEELVPLRLDVLSVKRLSGDTVQVRFTITNTGTGAKFEPYRELADPSKRTAYDVGGLALLDRPADKKYLTLYGTDGVCLCTAGLDSLELPPSGTAELYADVTAPPATVSTVDLSLPGFTPIAGLRIQ